MFAVVQIWYVFSPHNIFFLSFIYQTTKKNSEADHCSSLIKLVDYWSLQINYSIQHFIFIKIHSCFHTRLFISEKVRKNK